MPMYGLGKLQACLQFACIQLPSRILTVRPPLSVDRHILTRACARAHTQRDTPWSDGAAGVTNCPVAAGAGHTYRFQVPEPGTFWCVCVCLCSCVCARACVNVRESVSVSVSD